MKNIKELKNTKVLNNATNISLKSIIHLFSSKLIFFFTKNTMNDNLINNLIV